MLRLRAMLLFGALTLAACAPAADSPAAAVVGPPQLAVGDGPAPPPGDVCPYCNLYDNEEILNAAIQGIASRCPHEGGILQTMRNEGRLYLQHGVTVVDTNWTTMTITTRTGMALTTTNGTSDSQSATTVINTAEAGWERELENTLAHEKGHIHLGGGTEAQADGTMMACGVVWPQ